MICATGIGDQFAHNVNTLGTDKLGGIFCYDSLTGFTRLLPGDASFGHDLFHRIADSFKRTFRSLGIEVGNAEQMNTRGSRNRAKVHGAKLSRADETDPEGSMR
jgi:hypothetical protein